MPSGRPVRPISRARPPRAGRPFPQHYDDPAYSGGNLDRPALKKLLTDIEAGRIDVVVVYKIDRLTRSLADFAKLVEAFDARSISFVAVTQQFNTTTSMGRLTLNVLLSFAQFERELSSERVRDKIAASRRKGKWTGGTVPLGYDAKDKKLVVNKAEAEVVRTIFRRYLDLQSFSKLVADLDRRGIVTKKRATRVAKYNGAIPFTYGPLAYFLKNRIYLGEMHHGGKWFEGEHEAIVDQATFDRVQQLLATKSNGRKVKRSDSGALLLGKLYDDKGNRMSPSFSSKNGVRYRFYVSSAVLRGRKAAAGSVGRIAAAEIESAVLAALAAHLPRQGLDGALVHIDKVQRVIVASDQVLIAIAGASDDDGAAQEIRVPWLPKPKNAATVEEGRSLSEGARNEKSYPVRRSRACLDAMSPQQNLRINRGAGRSQPTSSQGRATGPAAGVPCAGCHISAFRWQTASRVLAGADPKTASLVVGRAPALARLRFGYRMLWNTALHSSDRYSCHHYSRLDSSQSVNTTVRLPFRITRSSRCVRTARASTRRSMSRPLRTRSSGLSRWLIRSTSCSIIGPSSRSDVT